MAITQEVAYGIVRGLKEFWKCEELQGFTVQVGTNQIKCHRLILAACSDCFRGLFRSGMKETAINCVPIPNVSKETFELILKSLYTGHGVLTNDNVIDIWRAAHQLQIHFLVSECESFVIDTLSMDNFAEYYYISNYLNSDVVLDVVWPFVLKNCKHFFQTNYFLELPKEDVLTLIKSQDLETNSEDEVIEAILKRVDFQINKDKQSLSCETVDGSTKSDKINQVIQNDDKAVDEPSIKKSKQSENTVSGNSLIVSNNLEKSMQTESYDDICIQKAATGTYTQSKVLAVLLSRARMCLVSHRCLKMLVNHPLVRDNKNAKNIVINAMLYQFQAVWKVDQK